MERDVQGFAQGEERYPSLKEMQKKYELEEQSSVIFFSRSKDKQ